MDGEGDMIIISKEMCENLLGKRRHANVNQSRPAKGKRLSNEENERLEGNNCVKHVESGSVTGNSSKHVTEKILKMTEEYNSDDDTSTDVEILDSDQIIKGGASSAFCSFEDLYKCKRNAYAKDLDVSVESSDYRDRVLKILEKPFDKQEYRRLSENANMYLTNYPDLKMKLDEYRYEKLTCMTILRGFFFWLQNVVHDKAFKPWQDTQCLAVMPGSAKRNVASKRRHVNVNRSRPVKRKSCFAAIVPDNLKLVYLKRSWVQEILKVPESFDSKIVGSFVRMRSDPFDISRKNPFQLQLVTGVEKVSEASTEVCLKVANYFQDIPISKLSDGAFTDEEIEDVRDRIKAGALQRLTAVELKAKVQTLHADITKHGIARELILLKRRIERANEKGWRRELYKHLRRRKLLQTPSEVEKLLHKIPKVIAEEVDPNTSAMTPMASENVEENSCSLTSIPRVTSDVSKRNV